MLPYYFSTHYFPYIYSNYSGYYYNHHYYPYTTTTLLYSFLPYNNCSTTNNCSPHPHLPSSLLFFKLFLQNISIDPLQSTTCTTTQAYNLYPP